MFTTCLVVSCWSVHLPWFAAVFDRSFGLCVLLSALILVFLVFEFECSAFFVSVGFAVVVVGGGGGVVAGVVGGGVVVVVIVAVVLVLALGAV